MAQHFAYVAASPRVFAAGAQFAGRVRLPELGQRFAAGSAHAAVADRLAAQQLRDGLKEWRAIVWVQRLGGAPDHRKLSVRQREHARIPRVARAGRTATFFQLRRQLRHRSPAENEDVLGFDARKAQRMMQAAKYDGRLNNQVQHLSGRVLRWEPTTSI